MTRLLMVVLIAVLVPSWGCADEDRAKLKDEKDRLSYSIGYQVGGDFKRQGIEIRKEALIRGVLDAINEGESALTNEEMRDTLVKLQEQVVEKRAVAMKAAGEANQKAGEAFLAENGKKPGVVTTSSGLQYKVLKEGNGKTAAPGEDVTVHYRGTLIDGTEFDSSYSRGEPATFPSDRVIRGWVEALSLMKEGSKWELYIPSQLAYGERGAGAKIGPNSTLIFEVELLSVGPPKQTDK